MTAVRRDERLLLLARHGETAPNAAGLRCGGDLDVEMTPRGRDQMRALALQLASHTPRVELIVSSGLRRTHEAAALIAAALPGARRLDEPELAERRLGRWNLLPVAQTQPWFDEGCAPPDGESDADFTARIAAALAALRPALGPCSLLIGSKGVGRVLARLAGRQGRLLLDNAQWLPFRLAEFDAALGAEAGRTAQSGACPR